MWLFRSSGLGLASRLIALVLTAGTHLWLARELGPSGYGGFVLALVIQGTVALASNVGIGSALSYYVAQQPGQARQIVWSGLIVSAVSVAPTLLLAWLVLLGSDAPVFPGLPAGWVAVALVTVPLRLLQEDLAGVWVGLGALGRMYAQTAVAPLLFPVALLTARVGGILDPATVATAWLLANVGAVSSATVLTIAALPLDRVRSPAGRFRLVLGLLAVGAQQTLNLGAWWFVTRTGRVIVGAVAGTDGVGRFAVSASIAEILLQIPSAIQVALFSRIARGEAGIASSEVQRLTRVALLIVAIVSFAVAIAATWFIEVVLGPSYRDAAPTLIALTPGVIGLAPVTIIGAYFLARFGQPAVNLIPTGAALATLVPAVWTLTYLWGIVGAGLGTSLAYVVAGGVATALFSARSRLGWKSTVLPTASDGRLLLRLLITRRSPPRSA